MTLSDRQKRQCDEHSWDFSGLRAVFLNCTLKRSPEPSHTQGLIDLSAAILERNGVAVEVLRPVDFEVAPGVWPDMTEHGWERDATCGCALAPGTCSTATTPRGRAPPERKSACAGRC